MAITSAEVIERPPSRSGRWCCEGASRSPDDASAGTAESCGAPAGLLVAKGKDHRLHRLRRAMRAVVRSAGAIGQGGQAAVLESAAPLVPGLAGDPKSTAQLGHREDAVLESEDELCAFRHWIGISPGHRSEQQQRDGTGPLVHFRCVTSVAEEICYPCARGVPSTQLTPGSKHMENSKSFTKKEIQSMTVNERLYVTDNLYKFEDAVENRNWEEARSILRSVYLDSENIEAILKSEGYKK